MGEPKNRSILITHHRWTLKLNHFDGSLAVLLSSPSTKVTFYPVSPMVETVYSIITSSSVYSTIYSRVYNLAFVSYTAYMCNDKLRKTDTLQKAWEFFLYRTICNPSKMLGSPGSRLLSTPPLQGWYTQKKTFSSEAGCNQ